MVAAFPSLPHSLTHSCARARSSSVRSHQPTRVTRPLPPSLTHSLTHSLLRARTLVVRAQSPTNPRHTPHCPVDILQVLLSMGGEDFVAHLGLAGDPFFAFQTAVRQLKQERQSPSQSASRAVNEPLDALLSSAVVRALSGDAGSSSNGAAASFPIEYIRRCTHGFADSHIIGRGGFGTVYRAVDPVVGVRFAVKRLNTDTLASTPQRRRAAEQVRRHHDPDGEALRWCR